ncbi:hypothetical protein AB0B69_00915 [Micromonospora parva]|uniref:hypothetical protein n=1 Tax=Micromonospora parva TaxID=1464048 RepID=UPI0033C1EDB6
MAAQEKWHCSSSAWFITPPDPLSTFTSGDRLTISLEQDVTPDPQRKSSHFGRRIRPATAPQLPSRSIAPGDKRERHRIAFGKINE